MKKIFALLLLSIIFTNTFAQKDSFSAICARPTGNTYLAINGRLIDRKEFNKFIVIIDTSVYNLNGLTYSFDDGLSYSKGINSANLNFMQTSEK